ncbi:MAG: SDR family oxidoreductase [Anaerolineae bacterium]|nr:SDR family oxidoreductase [Anaerolineae bacterium]
MLFDQKTVLITGGASGIGRQCALAFAREGAAIVISDVDAAGSAATVALVQNISPQIVAVPGDVTRAEDVAAMVAAARERFGGLHVAVNSAGISGTFDHKLHETDEATYARVMDINVKGVWLCLKQQIPAILSSGGGAIVNLASVAGLVGAPYGSIYAASKHAVIGLTKSAALEYARSNLRVNAVCPSYTDTPMVSSITAASTVMAQRTQQASPMKRLGLPEEIAATVLWLCSDQASFINGAALAVDGGLTAG